MLNDWKIAQHNTHPTVFQTTSHPHSTSNNSEHFSADGPARGKPHTSSSTTIEASLHIELGSHLRDPYIQPQGLHQEFCSVGIIQPDGASDQICGTIPEADVASSKSHTMAFEPISNDTPQLLAPGLPTSQSNRIIDVCCARSS